MSTQSLETFEVQSKNDSPLFDELQTHELNCSPRSFNCQANYKVQINLSEKNNYFRVFVKKTFNATKKILLGKVEGAFKIL